MIYLLLFQICCCDFTLFAHEMCYFHCYASYLLFTRVISAKLGGFVCLVSRVSCRVDLVPRSTLHSTRLTRHTKPPRSASLIAGGSASRSPPGSFQSLLFDELLFLCDGSLRSLRDSPGPVAREGHLRCSLAPGKASLSEDVVRGSFGSHAFLRKVFAHTSPSRSSKVRCSLTALTA